MSDKCNHGLILNSIFNLQKFSLCAYSDSDWASDPDDQWSTSSSCVFPSRNLIAWFSKKQSLPARSSAEVEYRALAHTTSEVFWIESLLRDLKNSISNTNTCVWQYECCYAVTQSDTRCTYKTHRIWHPFCLWMRCGKKVTNPKCSNSSTTCRHIYQASPFQYVLQFLRQTQDCMWQTIMNLRGCIKM